MTDRDEETCSLTLRSVRRQTIDALYELKALKAKTICRLVDEIVTDYFEKNPSLLAMRQERSDCSRKSSVTHTSSRVCWPSWVRARSRQPRRVIGGWLAPVPGKQLV